MEPVGQLDQQDPDVPGHGHDHLADVLGLLLLPRPERDRLQLRQPVDDARHVRAEVGLELLQSDLRVLHHVVEESGRQGRGVEAQIRQDLRHGQGVLHEVVAGEPLLAGVARLGEPIGPFDLPDVGPRVVGPHRAEERFEALPFDGVVGAGPQARQQASTAFRPGLLRGVHGVLLDLKPILIVEE